MGVIQAAAINMPTENNEDGNDAYAIASQRALQRFRGLIGEADEPRGPRRRPATPAATTPDAAPTPRAQRGPKLSATQPTIGAPIGVPPSPMPMRSAITRPRIAGSSKSCNQAVRRVGESEGGHADDDQGGAEQANSFGADARQLRSRSPKTAAPTSNEPNCGLLRPAPIRAPQTVPMAMIDDQRAYPGHRHERRSPPSSR